MSDTRDDRPGADVPEADRLEQEQQAAPEVEPATVWPEPAPQEADEADRLEQVQEVVADPDEEYEPDSP